MASNSDQSLVLAFGGFFQFLGPTKPFGSLLRCCCCAKWLEQMISTVFWPIIFTLKHSGLFRATCRFWGKQHMWSIQRKKQWRQSLPRQSPKRQLTLQEQNVSNRKRPKGTTSSRRRLIPTNKTRRRIRVIADAKQGNPANDSAETWSQRPVVLKSTESSRSIVAVCQADKDGTLRKDETSYRLADVCRAQYYSVQTPMVVD